MKKLGVLKLFIGVLATSSIIFSCQSDDASSDSSEKREVIENYTTLVYQNYLQSYNDGYV